MFDKYLSPLSEFRIRGCDAHARCHASVATPRIEPPTLDLDTAKQVSRCLWCCIAVYHNPPPASWASERMQIIDFLCLPALTSLTAPHTCWHAWQ